MTVQPTTFKQASDKDAANSVINGALAASALYWTIQTNAGAFYSTGTVAAIGNIAWLVGWVLGLAGLIGVITVLNITLKQPDSDEAKNVLSRPLTTFTRPAEASRVIVTVAVAAAGWWVLALVWALSALVFWGLNDDRRKFQDGTITQPEA